MVLQDLGRRINAAVTDLTRSPTLDEKAFDGMIKEISNALVEADVNINDGYVMEAEDRGVLRRPREPARDGRDRRADPLRCLGPREQRGLTENQPLPAYPLLTSHA